MVTMKSYENSKADEKADRKGAKKRGVSLKKYEKSKADRKDDRAEVKKLNRRRTILDKGGN